MIFHRMLFLKRKSVMKIHKIVIVKLFDFLNNYSFKKFMMDSI
ncbi:hypothetical protein LEP1GSC084_0306 [Leptospira interrogans serovar Medanensis str. L0448]|nr:hypothetical protein LEP1GSC099_4830 [Leptospira interrogans str. UI 08452]EMN33780.1 hypothetical protein LEP1GSC084_0306 [Leptospira interrogans serovar Medanensis str. L0448]